MSSTNEPNKASINPLLYKAGSILFLMQQLENVVELCCRFLQVEGFGISVDDLLAAKSKNRHQTLGKMIKALKEPTGFKHSFLDRLDQFVQLRNHFIHEFWPSNEIFLLDEVVDKAIFEKLHEAESGLLDETVYMTRIFIGYYYLIGGSIAYRDGRMEDFENMMGPHRMDEYILAFLNVVEVAKA